jgi:poly-beta-hydroxybutyrate-responsive repressor
MCNTYHSENGEHGCFGPPAGRVLGFIQPWLLLLLLEKPAHGYQLLDKLNRSDDTRGIDPGFLYRTLRKFEEDGLVRSSWDMEGQGPARRVYEITPDGIEYLHAWAGHVRSTRERLDRFLQAYESHFKSQTPEERR